MSGRTRSIASIQNAIMLHDIYLSALLMHQGHQFLGIEAIGRNKFYFVCAAEDLKHIRAEYDSPDSTLVGIKLFVECIQQLYGFIQEARRQPSSSIWFGFLQGETVITS
jgi:hypothetical protein